MTRFSCLKSLWRSAASSRNAATVRCGVVLEVELEEELRRVACLPQPGFPVGNAWRDRGDVDLHDVLGRNSVRQDLRERGEAPTVEEGGAHRALDLCRLAPRLDARHAHAIVAEQLANLVGIVRQQHDVAAVPDPRAPRVRKLTRRTGQAAVLDEHASNADPVAHLCAKIVDQILPMIAQADPQPPPPRDRLSGAVGRGSSPEGLGRALERLQRQGLLDQVAILPLDPALLQRRRVSVHGVAAALLDQIGLRVRPRLPRPTVGLALRAHLATEGAVGFARAVPHDDAGADGVLPHVADDHCVVGDELGQAPHARSQRRRLVLHQHHDEVDLHLRFRRCPHAPACGGTERRIQRADRARHAALDQRVRGDGMLRVVPRAEQALRILFHKGEVLGEGNDLQLPIR
eukprot:scaffold1220_cov259-Pinguiococcus_pyrenoidosus.AAC.135